MSLLDSASYPKGTGDSSPGSKAVIEWRWHSSPSSSDNKNACSYISSPTIHLHGVVLHRDNFIFTFTVYYDYWATLFSLVLKLCLYVGNILSMHYAFLCYSVILNQSASLQLSVQASLNSGQSGEARNCEIETH